VTYGDLGWPRTTFNLPTEGALRDTRQCELGFGMERRAHRRIWKTIWNDVIDTWQGS